MRTPAWPAKPWRRRVLPILAMAAVVWIGGTSLAAQRGSAKKPATHTVTIDGAQFTPATLTVKAGDTVVWVNKDILAHTATAEKKGAVDSKVIQPGKSWKFVARTKGEFPYTCAFHPMNGKLIVR
jgi:plastocyanin